MKVEAATRGLAPPSRLRGFDAPTSTFVRRRSWRFLNAARCWAGTLARGDNASKDRLGDLDFPLCQVLFGAAGGVRESLGLFGVQRAF